jgi:lysophospholipase L1-like esterase
MDIPPGSRVVFIGDSITDCGRARPAVEDDPQGLGDGYVSLIDAIITACEPTARWNIVNVGEANDTVSDLAARWERDVLAWYPEWLSILIGINDVWRSIDFISGGETQVSLDEYSNTLRELVQTTKPILQGLVLMTPYYVQSDKSDPMRAMMDNYSQAVREIAAENNVRLVDTQAEFDRVMRIRAAKSMAEDHIHVNLVGHMVLARGFLNAVKFTWK